MAAVDAPRHDFEVQIGETVSMWRRACMGLVAVVGALVLAASPAGAKFWQFELQVDSNEVVAGDTVHMEAVVADYGVEDAVSNPEMVPPVEVYRADDLPASGQLAGDIEPIKTVAWTHIGDGRYSGEVALSEPGSYEIVSMGVWNMELQGYPQPISLTVTEAAPPSVAVASESGLPLRWTAVAAGAAITALIGFGFVRRRRDVIPA